MRKEEKLDNGNIKGNEPTTPKRRNSDGENRGQRLTGSVPGPSEFREGFEGEPPSNFQPLFPGQSPPVQPVTPHSEAAQVSPPPAETQQD